MVRNTPKADRPAHTRGKTQARKPREDYPLWESVVLIVAFWVLCAIQYGAVRYYWNESSHNRLFLALAFSFAIVALIDWWYTAHKTMAPIETLWKALIWGAVIGFFFAAFVVNIYHHSPERFFQDMLLRGLMLGMPIGAACGALLGILQGFFSGKEETP